MSRDETGRHIAEIIARLRPWQRHYGGTSEREIPKLLDRPIKWHTVAYRN